MTLIPGKYFTGKKTVLVVFTIAVSILFISFKQKKTNDADPRAKYEKILRNVGVLLEQGHVSPKKIDDSFSKDVFNYFIKELDDDKSLFLQSDVDALKKYENKIDDEIHGDENLSSFFAITDIYNKRLDEASKLYSDILANPFDFTVDESVELDGDKLNFPTSEQERKEVWRKKLKYLSIVKYVDMLEDKEKSKLKGQSSGAESLSGISILNQDGKISLSIDSLADKKITQLIIQRSADSFKKFTSILSVSNVSRGRTIGIENLQIDKNYYYRVFADFGAGSYKIGKVVQPLKDDNSLEALARDQVKKQIGRYFTTLKNHNTTDELFSTFVNSVTATMDPHTDYFAPIDQRSFNEAISGSFYGIGAQLKEEESKIKIASLVTGSPAWKSGEIQIGDEIIKIGEGKKEPVDVTGYAIVDAVKLIRGAEKGSEVRLTLRKPDGSIKVVPLLRDQIKLDDTFAKSAIIKGEHKIGYIYLPEFYVDFERKNGAKCSEDVAREIEKLKKEKVDGIIMDLRSNGGGSLPEVVKMAGLFIDEGPICQVRGRDEKPFLWKDRDKSVLYDGPLTVMVDENSASASEIFAAAIQDYKRGIIVGSSSTFGKGTVQRSIPLNPEAENELFTKNSEDLGSIKLTLQKFYRINGGSTQLKGVIPDVVLPDRYELAKSREKDYPNALGWDEIPRSDYKTWVTDESTDMVINYVRRQVDTNSIFSKLKKNIDWISSQNEKVYSLQIEKYRADLKRLKDAYKEMDDLSKLKKDLVVVNVSDDIEKNKADKEKVEKNKQFLSRIKSDVYIDENIKIINQLIGNNTQSKLKLAGK